MPTIDWTNRTLMSAEWNADRSVTDWVCAAGRMTSNSDWFKRLKKKLEEDEESRKSHAANWSYDPLGPWDRTPWARPRVSPWTVPQIDRWPSVGTEQDSVPAPTLPLPAPAPAPTPSVPAPSPESVPLQPAGKRRIILD